MKSILARLDIRVHRDGWNTSRTNLETFEVETVKHRGGLIATVEGNNCGNLRTTAFSVWWSVEMDGNKRATWQECTQSKQGSPAMGELTAFGESARSPSVHTRESPGCSR